MRRGTTPTNTFNTSVSLAEAEVIYITYQQKRQTVVEKTIDDITVTADALTVELTQEETLLFDDRYSVSIQIRARFPDGSAIASNIMTVPVGKILKGGAI